MQKQKDEEQRPQKLEVAYDQNTIKQIIKIQKAWRKYKSLKKLKKRIKKMKNRIQISHQLLSSEQTYCSHLSLIIQQVVKPSLEVIEDQQMHILLFSNLQSIYTIHQQFLIQLTSVMKNYNHSTTCLSSVINHELFSKHDFKALYSSYCVNYPKSNKMAKILFSNNTGFRNLLKQAHIDNSNELDSYLIKPMQRLCKYELLIRNYIKNMQPENLDYDDLKKTILQVEKLVKETNEQVDEFLLGEKFNNDILGQFGDTLTELPNAERKLVFTVGDIELVNEENSHYRELHLFNDAVLLAPVPPCKPLFCSLGTLRTLPNLKYFHNLVQMITKDRYLTIEFKQQKHKQNFLEACKKTSMSTNNNNFVSVTVLGTETRESMFKEYTVYILEIRFSEDNIKRIYPRFKTLLTVQKMVDPKKIRVNLPVLSKELLKGTKSKTIESRKLLIQQFLEKLLNCKDSYQVPEIFRALNLVPQQNSNKSEEEVTIALPNAQTIKIVIDVKNATIGDLKTVITHNLGLVHSQEFEIFESKNKIRRLMHDNELVTHIYECQKNKFYPFNAIYIYTRHRYLSPEQQLAYYKEDFLRAKLQLSVIRSSILKYRLSEEVMIAFMCLFAMYINLNVQDDSKLSAFIKEVCRKDYKLPKEDFRVYYSEVEKKVEFQEDDEMVVLPFLIIKIISETPLYYCQQFEVTLHPKSYKSIKTYLPNLEEKLTLGIKPTHLLLLTTSQKTLIQSFQLEEVEIAEVHPIAIVLRIYNISPVFKLSTQNAFEISKLLQIYQTKK